MKKKSDLVFKMVLTAIFAALCYVITWLVAIPIPGTSGAGYINLSDLFIFVIAGLVDPWTAGIVGGLAGMLADITSGYGFFAPFTLLIKFIEGVVSGFFFKAIIKGDDTRKKRYLKSLLAFIAGGLLMAALYMIPDYVTYTSITVSSDPQSFYFIFFDFAFNIIQGIVNAVLGSFAYLGLFQVKGLTQRNFGVKQALTDKEEPAGNKSDNIEKGKD